MPRPRKSEIGLLVIGLGTVAAPLDTAVNIALPSITQVFDLTLGDIRWIVVAHVLTYASLMLVFGRLGDLVGYRPIFRLGLFIGALGLAACSVAPAYGWLLLGRILQGVGMALTLSCGPALAMSLYDQDKRALALAFYVGITAGGAALGPLLGGLLINCWGWQAVFWFRVPLLLAALTLSKLIPPSPAYRSAGSFDVLGAALVVTWTNMATCRAPACSRTGSTRPSGAPGSCSRRPAGESLDQAIGTPDKLRAQTAIRPSEIRSVWAYVPMISYRPAGMGTSKSSPRNQFFSI